MPVPAVSSEPRFPLFARKAFSLWGSLLLQTVCVFSVSVAGLGGCGKLYDPELLARPDAAVGEGGEPIKFPDPDDEVRDAAPDAAVLHARQQIGEARGQLEVMAATLKFQDGSYFGEKAEIQMTAINPASPPDMTSVPVRGAIGHIYKIAFSRLPDPARRPTFSLDLEAQSGMVGNTDLRPESLRSALVLAQAHRISGSGQWEWVRIQGTQLDPLGHLLVNNLNLAPNGGSAPGEAIIGLLLDCDAQAPVCTSTWGLSCESACREVLEFGCGNGRICQ